MPSRGRLLAVWVSCLAVVRNARGRWTAFFSGESKTTPADYGEEIGQFWLLHLRYKHARGRNAERFQINRQLIALAFFMKDGGVPLEDIRAVAREGLARAKADYGTQRDPFSRLQAA